MLSELAITRQQYLYQIATFCRGLDEWLRGAGFSSEQSLEIFRTSISAECTRCSIKVSGEELFALSQPPAAERATAKIGRMRLGDCARKDCTGCYYSFFFASLPQLDWAKILAHLDSTMDSQAQPQPAQEPHVLKWHFSVLFKAPVFAQIAIAVALISVLLVVHQWRQGGRIPFIREPEQFHVDTLPEEPIPSGTKSFPSDHIH